MMRFVIYYYWWSLWYRFCNVQVLIMK